MSTNKILNFGQWLAENKRTPMGARLNEAEGETEVSEFGKSNNITQFSLYKYGIFNTPETALDFYKNLSIGAYLKMDTDTKKSVIWYLLNLSIPSTKKIKAFRGEPTVNQLYVDKAKNSEKYSMPDNVFPTDDEIFIADKNNFCKLIVNKEGAVCEDTGNYENVDLSANILKMTCYTLEKPNTRTAISLGGFIETLKEAEDENVFREEKFSNDYTKKGMDVIKDMASNIASNFKSPSVQKAKESWAKTFEPKSKEESYALENLPKQEVIESLPELKEVIINAKNQKGKSTLQKEK